MIIGQLNSTPDRVRSGAYLMLDGYVADGAPIWLQLQVLGTIVNIVFSSADVLCVVLAHKVTAYSKCTASGNRIGQRLGGSILIALGLNVALNRQ